MTKNEQEKSSTTTDPKSGRATALPVIGRPSIAECVLPGHPDRICDRIADLLVDTACARDPLSLVGVEVALHQSAVFVTGCVFTSPPLRPNEVEAIVQRAFVEAGYREEWKTGKLRIETDLRLDALDDDLRGFRHLSDDQAICVGYACGSPADRYLPRAHRLAWLAGEALGAGRGAFGLGPDGKVIVALDGDAVASLSISIQHPPRHDRRDVYRLAAVVGTAIGLEDLDRVIVNGAGDFAVGGPLGDNGLSGKKLVVDAYGPGVPIGGGAWCGKDPHKIDRVGGLRARELAVRAVRLGLGRAATVTLGWHPGDAAPARVSLDVDGAPRPIEALGPADLSIQGTWQELGLGQVRFADYSDGGWFQRPAPWEFDRPQFQGAA